MNFKKIFKFKSEYEKIKEAKQTKNINDIAIEVVSFTKKYTSKSNDGVSQISFNVKKGSFHGFIGANGAGKTTTIKGLIDAYGNYDGQINFFGHKNNTLPAKVKIGYIPENAIFPSEIKLFDYIRNMAILSGLPPKLAKDEAKKVINIVGMNDFVKRKPNSLSSGQKKKVLLANALISNPEILIMDEPTTNLDPSARNDFFKVLKELNEMGKTIFISSHVLSELEKFIDSVTVIDKGRILYSGDVKNLFTSNKNEYSFVFGKIEDVDKVTKWAKDLNYRTTDNKFEIIIAINLDSVKTSLLSFIDSNKLNLIEMKPIKNSLDTVYDSLIKR